MSIIEEDYRLKGFSEEPLLENKEIREVWEMLVLDLSVTKVRLRDVIRNHLGELPLEKRQIIGDLVINAREAREGYIVAGGTDPQVWLGDGSHRDALGFPPGLYEVE